MTNEEHEKLRLLKDAREAWIYDGDNEKYRRAFDDHTNPNVEINAEIDIEYSAELLRDLLDVAAVQRCEGLTAPETYEVLQDEPSDELMARLKAIVKRELKQD